jgi:predicted RNA-binding protein YlxR (DUF448 family)
MIRFVLHPEEGLVADVACRLPGRGVWVSAERAALEKAARRGGFSRGFGRAVTAPADLVDQTASLLRRRALNLIGLARRAGDAIAGFERVKDALKATMARDALVGLLLHAHDGAQAGREKLDGLLRAVSEDEDGEAPPVTPRSEDLFSADELGMALGQPSVIHLWLMPGGFSRQVRLEVLRLRGVLGQAC